MIEIESRVKKAEQKGVQNAELRIVGTIHESPENKQIFGCKKTTGRGSGDFCEANSPRSEAEFTWLLPKTNGYREQTGGASPSPTMCLLYSRRFVSRILLCANLNR